MPDNLNDIIRKIRGILRIAARSDKPGEAASAQELAQKLIAKYQIADAQLHDYTSVDGISSKIIENPPPHEVFKSILLNAIAKNNFCRVLRGNRICVIYGYPSDIDICLALYEEICVHMLFEMQIKLDIARSEGKIDTKQWTKSFFAGYCNTIKERLQSARKKINGTIGNNLMVAVKQKEHAIENYWQRDINKKSSTIKSVEVTSDGYNEGVVSAKKAKLNKE